VPHLLDANVFIRAKNLHYGFDFCPAFWDWIDQANALSRVFSINRVADEPAGGADDLTTWAAERAPQLFLPPDATVLPSLPQVSQWATGGQYEQAAVNTFLQVADLYLVAQAHAGDHVVVTHEISSVSTKRIKIPNACISLGVKCVTPYEMLRTERARFVLRPDDQKT